MSAKFVRLSLFAALIAMLGTMSISSASASAEGTKCGIGGEWKIRPSVTETPRTHTIRIDGYLGPCTGTFANKAHYHATLTTTPITCAELGSGAGNPSATGTIAIKWTPYAHNPRSPKASSGTLTVPLTEETAVSLSGTVERGAFAGMHISGTVYDVYGPEACGFNHGSFYEEPPSEFVLM